MQTFAFAMLAAALYGTGLVTTYCGLRHMQELAGARVSIPSAAVLLRQQRLSGRLIGGAVLTVAGIAVLLVR